MMPAHLKWHYAGCFLLGVSLSMIQRGLAAFGVTLVCTIFAFAISSLIRASEK